MTLEENITHGLGSTIIAFTIPEPWLSVGQRFVFALSVAVCSTLASKLLSLMWGLMKGAK